MASIPGVQFSITGATGSQAALSAKSGYFCYVFPRGAWASQDSTGTLITFDSADIASRFAADDWIQVGLATGNLRKVNAVGGNSLSVQGAAVTVTEDNRVFLIGSTQPSTSGGSATYTIPATIIRHRDDDTSDRYTNSMLTSDSDGLIRFYATQGIYDTLIQDGNQGNQGYIADLPVGTVEGVSTVLWAVFGATVTINAALGVTGTITANTVTVNRALGVTGWATFGQTVTMNAALGVTGWATFGASVTLSGPLGVTGTATFGATITGHGAFGITGVATFGSTASFSGVATGVSDFIARRFRVERSTEMTSARWGLRPGWGSTAAVTVSNGSTDQAGQVSIVSNGATFSQDPAVGVTFIDGGWVGGRHGVATLTRVAPDLANIPIRMSGQNATQITWIAGVTPSANQQYNLQYIFFGTTGGF